MHLPIKNLTALAVAVQVADTGSFAGAARALGLSTSAVSKSISRLEEQLDLKLFNRTTRSVSLTVDGRAYLQSLKPLLLEIGNLTQDVVDAGNTPRGLIRVGAPVSFGRILLAPVVAAFGNQFPEVEIELVLDDKMVDLANDQIDVSIRTGNLSDSANIVARTFMSDPMILCASKQYLTEASQPQTVDELRNHRRVTFRNNRDGRNEAWELANGERILQPGIIQSNTMDSVIEMVRSGAGIGQVSHYKVQHWLQTGDLVEILPSTRPAELKYSILYLNRHLLAPRIRTFIDFLLEWFEERLTSRGSAA